MLAVAREIHLGEHQDIINSQSEPGEQTISLHRRRLCKERQRGVSHPATYAAQGGNDGGGRISLSASGDHRGIGHLSRECCSFSEAERTSSVARSCETIDVPWVKLT